MRASAPYVGFSRGHNCVVVLLCLFFQVNCHLIKMQIQHIWNKTGTPRAKGGRLKDGVNHRSWRKRWKWGDGKRKWDVRGASSAVPQSVHRLLCYSRRFEVSTSAGRTTHQRWHKRMHDTVECYEAGPPRHTVEFLNTGGAMEQYFRERVLILEERAPVLRTGARGDVI